MAKTCVVVPCFRDSRFSLEGCELRRKELEEEKAEIFSFVTLYKAIISDVNQGFSMVLLWSEADIQQNKESVEAYKFFV